MTRIFTTIEIPRSTETVFRYVTTSGHWPEWHPSSLGVSGATDHSMGIGEEVTEAFFVAGRRGKVTWTVKDYAYPRCWVIEGKIAGGGGGGTITYTLRPHGDITIFEREFIYSMPNLVLALLDWLVLRRRVEAESTQALRQLKRALAVPAGPDR